MKISLNYETLGFVVAPSVAAKLEGSGTVVNLQLSQLSVEDLTTLCDEHRAKVFNLADKRQPRQWEVPKPPVPRYDYVATVCEVGALDGSGYKYSRLFSWDGPCETAILHFEVAGGVKFLPPKPLSTEPALPHGLVLQGYVYERGRDVGIPVFSTDGGPMVKDVKHFRAASSGAMVPELPAQTRHRFETEIAASPIRFSTEIGFLSGEYISESTRLAFYAWKVVKGYLA